MADDVTHTSTSPAGPPDGTKQVTDEHVTRGHMPVVKLAIATDGSATLVPADATDGLLVNLGANNDVTVTSIAAGSNNIGDVDVLTVPADPFGTNADVASATGSISAKLRQIAANGIATTATLAAETTKVIGTVNIAAAQSITVTQGTATNLKVDASGVAVPVTDNAGSLTVDAPVATPVFVRLSDGASAISTMPVSATQLPAALAAGGGLKVEGIAGGVAQPMSSTQLPAALAANGGMKIEGVASGVAVPMSASQLPAALAANGGLKIEGVASGVAVPVSIATVPSHAVTNAGTFAVQVDGSALTALQLIDDPVFADDAAFTIATSKVMMAGGAVVAHGSNPDAADAGDAGAVLMNRHRVLFTIGGHPNTVTLKHTSITTAVTDAAIVTVSAGTKIVVTRLSVTLDSASTVFPTVLIGFGTASTPTTTGVLAAHGGVPAGGGFTIGDGSGILGIGADNEDLRVTTTGNATGNGLQITVSYYTIES